MKPLAAAAIALAAILALPAVVVLLAAGSPAHGGQPTSTARTEIPPGYLALYQAAPRQACPTLPWQVLAAIGWIESRHGTLDAPGVTADANLAGAAGPMQFGIGGKAGNTWGGAPTRPATPRQGYGIDGNGDGIADVYDPADAIPAAAGYLCAHGGGDPDRLRDALWAYNHSQAYVDQVLAKADDYATTATLGDTATGDV